MKKNIIIIGAGNMGASLLGGLINHGYSPEQLWITDTDQKKLNGLKQTLNINVTTQNNEAIQHADIIILAVKPQIISKIMAEMIDIIQSRRPLIVSIAAGIKIESLQRWLGDTIPIVRAMPNTPSLIGCGATALYANQHVTKEQHASAESLLKAVGICVWIQDEKQMDVITAVSGSGPAYFFLIIEAMQNAAVNLGLPKELAKTLTLQTAYGAAKMALESEEEVTKLRHNVTSPGGTTEKAISVLEQLNIRTIFATAIEKAAHRSKELAHTLDNH